MTENEMRPAEVFPPGEFIRDELEARGWEQRDLAEILGRPERLVSELITGKRTLTAETAQQLGEAFGTSAQVWLNLESAYQLHQLGKPDDSVARRARLYSIAPIKEMVRRGWIPESDEIGIMEAGVKDFFQTTSFDDQPNFFAAAARKGDSYDAEFTVAQQAWLFRARRLAKTLKAPPFDLGRFQSNVESLRPLLASAEGAGRVPKALASLGVRLVLVEHLPETRIDGACFWLDQQRPVVALSTRYDRIDSFWFTLMHELGHIAAGDGRDRPLLPDMDLVENTRASGNAVKQPREEVRANRFASTFLMAEAEVNQFIRHVKPQFSKASIEAFAVQHKIHPGLVVGQLHHRNAVPYSNLRSYLVKVRAHLLETALYDGWGSAPRID